MDNTQRIQQLQNRKVALLEQHGLFGGGQFVNRQFAAINTELENLGVGPDHDPSIASEEEQISVTLNKGTAITCWEVL